MKLTNDDYYFDLQEIKTQHKARLWSYVSGEVTIIESICLQNTVDVLKLGQLDESEEAQRQFDMYGLILERSLHHNLFEDVKTAIRINGFHDMNEDELKNYITDKATVMLSDSRSYINLRSHYYPLLRGRDDDRFDSEFASKFYEKIVRKSIKVSNAQKEEIRKLKQKYSFWNKVNFVGALLRKRKK